MHSEKVIADVLQDVVQRYTDGLPRSTQTAIGVSDIGGCREYARLKVTDTEPTDHPPSWAAFLGTAVHREMDAALEHAFRGHVITGAEVTVKYPNGSTMIGHPDWVFPDSNLVADGKTVDGLHAIRKTGPSNRQWMQVMGYGKALADEGTLTWDKPVRCALVFMDRSGREPGFVVYEREYDPVVINDADNWITDVIYAIEHDEPASKDRPIDWCEKFCDFYTTCRAGDAAPEGGLIEDPDVITAVDLYLEGSDLERRGKAMKNEAKGQLEGVEGSTGLATVRWTVVGPSEIPGYVRDGYKKLNIRTNK